MKTRCPNLARRTGLSLKWDILKISFVTARRNIFRPEMIQWALKLENRFKLDVLETDVNWSRQVYHVGEKLKKVIGNGQVTHEKMNKAFFEKSCGIYLNT